MTTMIDKAKTYEIHDSEVSDDIASSRSATNPNTTTTPHDMSYPIGQSKLKAARLSRSAVGAPLPMRAQKLRFFPRRCK
jgi:hypothetical protein